MFKRKSKLSIIEAIRVVFYPKGGFIRAFRYISYRLKRMVDAADRVAFGVAIGVFVSFTPFFGFHMLLATLLAIVLRSIVFAALLATIVGNPLTFPVIAFTCIWLGSALISFLIPESLWQSQSGGHSGEIRSAFSQFGELISGGKTGNIAFFDIFWTVFIPYFIGGFILGSVCSVVAYYLTYKTISGYKNNRHLFREKRLKYKKILNKSKLLRKK